VIYIKATTTLVFAIFSIAIISTLAIAANAPGANAYETTIGQRTSANLADHARIDLDLNLLRAGQVGRSSADVSVLHQLNLAYTLFFRGMDWNDAEMVATQTPVIYSDVTKGDVMPLIPTGQRAQKSVIVARPGEVITAYRITNPNDHPVVVQFTGVDEDGTRMDNLITIPAYSQATLRKNGWVIIIIAGGALVGSFAIMVWVKDSVDGSVVDNSAKADPEGPACPMAGAEDEDECQKDLVCTPEPADCVPYTEKIKQEGYVGWMLERTREYFIGCKCV
jgi:hypothetical protein